MIDKINPTLRAIDNVNGKKRVREFYAMSAEDAYSLFEAMAEIHGTQNKLKLYKLTEQQKEDEQIAEEVKEEYEKAKPLTFSEYGIPLGSTLEFCYRGNENSGKTCVVIDEKTWNSTEEVGRFPALQKSYATVNTAFKDQSISSITGNGFLIYANASGYRK